MYYLKICYVYPVLYLRIYQQNYVNSTSIFSKYNIKFLINITIFLFSWYIFKWYAIFYDHKYILDTHIVIALSFLCLLCAYWSLSLGLNEFPDCKICTSSFSAIVAKLYPKDLNFFLNHENGRYPFLYIPW